MLFVNWLRAADSPLRRFATGGGLERRLRRVSPTAPEDISVVDLDQRFFPKTLQGDFGTLTTWALDQQWEFVRRLAWDWFKEGIAEWPMKDSRNESRQTCRSCRVTTWRRIRCSC